MHSRMRAVLCAISAAALLTAIAITATPAQASDCEFTNDNGSWHWEDADNWSCRRVPTARDTAIIRSEVQLTSNQTVGAMTLEGDGSLIPAPKVPSTLTLTVTGDFDWTGGSIGWDADPRLVVDWRGTTGEFVISGTDPKSIYRTGQVTHSGTKPIRIREDASLDIEKFTGRSWSLFTNGPLELGNHVSLSGDGWVAAGKLMVDESAFVNVARFAASTTELGNDAVLSISGGIFSPGPQATVTGDPSTPTLDGGRLITGAPLPGETEPNPTIVSTVAASLGGSKVTQGTATWEHRAGRIGGKLTLIGTPTSMPLVWSGGSLDGELIVGAQAAVEILGDPADPISITGPSGKLTVQGDVEIAENTKIDLDEGTAIAISSAGSVNQYAGSEINGTVSGPKTSTITNDGIWSAFGPAYTVVIRDSIVRGTGSWQREDNTYFEFAGNQPVDLGNLAVKVANGSGMSVLAANATLRIRKLSVTTGTPSAAGNAILIAEANQLNTTGMATQGLVISPTRVYEVTATATQLSLTPSAAASLSLECQGSCPTTARVNQSLQFSWIIKAISGQATGVVLKVNLPQGVTAYNVQQSCSIASRTITCQVGTVTSTPQQVYVTLRSASRGAKTITGTLTAIEAISDPSKARKSFSVNITR